MKKLLRIAIIPLLVLTLMEASAPIAYGENPISAGDGALQDALVDTAMTASAEATKDAETKYIENYIDRTIAGMTTEEKVGQLILARRPSKDAKAKQNKYQYGGFILFGRDFKNNTPEKLKNSIDKYQETSKVNMLIAVDEEGGTVVRASEYPQFRDTPFKSPRSIYSRKGYKGIINNTAKKDDFLKSLGINCNLAPVSDVTYDKSDYMYDRAICNNADKVAELVGYQVEQMGADNVVCALKHFPGYGDNVDTHGAVARDNRKRSTFEKRDLKPFRAGIENGADMIMVSHTIVNAFDKNRPASISAKVCNYIRDELDFDGVIITDGLAMQGIKDFVGGDEGDAAILAVETGCDMVCADNNAVGVYKSLNKAVADGEISEAQLDASVRRILRMKINRGIVSIPEEIGQDWKTEDKILMYIVTED